MRLTYVILVLSGLLALSCTDSNVTDSTVLSNESCLPCWTLFNRSGVACTDAECFFKPWSHSQSVCVDTLILLIIMFVSIVTLIPTCIWLVYVWTKRCRNIDAKYVVNERRMI